MRKVLSKNRVVVLPGFTVCLNTTCAALLSGRSYTIDACFARVYDALTNHGDYITYTNATSKPQTILRRAQVGIIREFEEDGCYIIAQDEETLTRLPASIKGARITKLAEVSEKTLENDVHVCIENVALATHIEALVLEF